MAIYKEMKTDEVITSLGDAERDLFEEKATQVLAPLNSDDLAIELTLSEFEKLEQDLQECKDKAIEANTKRLEDERQAAEDEKAVQEKLADQEKKRREQETKRAEDEKARRIIETQRAD